MTKIEWTHGLEGRTGRTWNPTTGCDRISPGCDRCYALTMAGRLKAMGQEKYQNDGDPRTSGPGFALAMHAEAVSLPLSWRKPSLVFVNSMSDLFHARVTPEFAARVWAVMAMTPHHVYQVLTKRPERARAVLGAERFALAHEAAVEQQIDALVRFGPPKARDWAETFRPSWPLQNVWLGTSIESDDYVRRADELRATPGAVRFLSLEPLIGPLPSLSTDGIDWVIIGGESGSGARPMRLGWVDALIAKCRATGTAVFVKQLGSSWAEDNGQRGKGGDWDTWPGDLKIREYPTAVPAAA